MIANRILIVVVACCALAPSSAVAQSAQRVVSLAPSVTEVLFEIGAGHHVAGVTSYCVYPKHALALPTVGGYLTPSYEALSALAPDLVVTLPEHRDIEHRLKALSLRVFAVDHRSLDGIVLSMRALGERCGVSAKATAAADALSQLLVGLKANARTRSRPRVLICFGRSPDFRRLYAASAGSVHDDLVVYAGGQNALGNTGVVYPTLSAEGVMRLDPDIIVEFAPGKGDAAALAREWHALDTLRAVKTGRVHVFTDEFLSVPGPRFVRFAETLARVFQSR